MQLSLPQLQSVIMKLPMLCAVLLGLFFTSATADFQQGHDAFNKGDYAAAIIELTPLAKKGNSEAQKLLGSMYRFGRGVPQDAKEAAKWYRLAAEQGNVDAQQDLGFMYEFGSGVETNAEEAAYWYRLAAERGSVFAQRRLRDIDQVGYVIGNDPKQQDSNTVRSGEFVTEAAKDSFLRALLASGAAAVAGGFLFTWISVRGAASSAHQLGRKWLAWVVLTATIAILSRFFGSLTFGVGTESDPLGSRCRHRTRFEVEGRSRQVGEFAGDEVGDGDQMLDGSVTAGFGLGGLDQRVGCLDAAVGELGVEGVEDAGPVILEGRGDLFDGFEVAATCPGVPLVEEHLGVRAVGGAVEDLAQGFLDAEGAVGLEVELLQVGELGALAASPGVLVLQPEVAAALEAGGRF